MSQQGQVVCFETFRREREQRQARVLPYLAPADRPAPRSPFRGDPLTGREVEHRQQMLRHLTDERREGLAHRSRLVPPAKVGQ